VLQLIEREDFLFLSIDFEFEDRFVLIVDRVQQHDVRIDRVH